MNAVSVNVNDLKWSGAAEYPTGTEEKVLNIGGSIRLRVRGRNTQPEPFG